MTETEPVAFPLADPATLRYAEGDVLSSLVSLPVAW